MLTFSPFLQLKGTVELNQTVAVDRFLLLVMVEKKWGSREELPELGVVLETAQVSRPEAVPVVSSLTPCVVAGLQVPLSSPHCPLVLLSSLAHCDKTL